MLNILLLLLLYGKNPYVLTKIENGRIVIINLLKNKNSSHQICKTDLPLNLLIRSVNLTYCVNNLIYS